MKNIWITLILGLFLISFASAWTGTDFIKDEMRLDEKTNYGKYIIEESSWYDPLGIWTKETLKEIELKTNTEQCVDCLSEGTIVLNKDGTLIDELIWKRSFDEGKTFVDWSGFINWKFLVEEDVDVYETICIDEKEIIDEKNGTSYFEQDCITSKVGTEKQWQNLDFKKEYKAGTYNYKIEGSKKASVTYDWIIKTNGELLTNWSVWGAVIGVGGVEASVTLNSPADGSTQYTNIVTLNASANISSGGAYLVNASLNQSVNGGDWEVKNSTQFFLNQTSHSANLNTVSGSQTAPFGMKIQTGSQGFYLFNVTKQTGRTETHVRLRTSGGGSNIASATYSGDTAVFSSPIWLNASSTYYILSDANGASYTTMYTNTVSYPYISEKFNWIAGWDGSIDRNNGAYSIKTIGYVINPNTSTQTFTNTYSAGDVVDWNIPYCDSDGDCGQAVSNYRFTIEEGAPEISLAYPTSLIDYGKLNGTLQLNFTATDTNLDKVWYDYNGTNITIAGAISGVYNVSNITLSTKKNITIYANDTAGNFNATTFSWDYRVFENSITFNNETRSGDQENYILNLTLHSSVDLTSAVLVFGNETLYPSIFSAGQDRIISITNYPVQSYQTDTNVTFYYVLTLDDSTEINTTENIQLIQAILLDNCGSYTYQLFNISLFDEESKSPLLGDIQLNYELLNKPAYQTINSLSLAFNNVSVARVCSDINLTGQNFVQSVEIRYVSEGYEAELYHIQRAEISPSNRQINLFDLNSNSSTEFKITYQDSTFNFVEGAIVQLQRQYISEDIFEIVEAPITSAEGVTVVHVDLNTIKYKATIVKNGVVLDVFDNLVFKCQSELTGECEQKLLGNINPQNEVPLESIIDFYYSQPILTNESISVSYVIPSGSPSAVNIILEQRDQFGNKTICNKTVTSSAGSISCDYEETLGQSFIDYTISKDNTQVARKSYVVDSDTSLDWLGNNYIFILIILLSLVGMALSSPEWIIINGIVTMVISGGLFLASGLSFVMGLGNIAWLVIASIILIAKISKQEDQ